MSRGIVGTLAGAGLTRVVATTDFSAGARAGLDRVALLPLGHRAQIWLVHVTTEVGGERRDRKASGTAALRQETSRLRQCLARHGRADVTVHPVLETTGRAFMRIPAVAGAVEAQLIVVGRHGGGLQSLVIGSTAERVVRGRAAPVLVVARPPRTAYARPLVAVDPEAPGGRRVVTFTLRLLGTHVSRVDVISAYQLDLESRLRRAGVAPEEIRRLRQREAAHCRRQLLAQLAGVRAGAAGVALTVRRGDPRRQILRFAAHRDADLLVLQTHARRGLLRFLLGSVAVEVLRSAKADILLLPTARD